MAGPAPRGAIAASPPPAGLPGLDPVWSRLVEASGSDGPRTWHVLDTGGAQAAAGVTPVGTLLCVHGNPTWSYLWRTVAAASLDRRLPGWRVVAVDQLEMGYSERTGRDRPLADRVRDLGALTDALQLSGPVVTVGHDWGGVVSMGWAVDHPELLAGVVLTNTAVHQAGGAAVPAPLRLALAPAVTAPGTIGTTAFLDTTMAIAHPRLAPEVRAAFRAPYRSIDRRHGIGGFVRDIPLAADHVSRAELDRIAAGVARLSVPALILWGPRDPVFAERYLADLMQRLPQASVHRFAGAGHLLPEDVDVAGAVFTWLGDRADGLGAAASTPDAAGENAPADASTASGPAPASDSTRSESHAFEPLWSAIEGRADDDGLALAELAPRGGGDPRLVSWRTLAVRVSALAAGLASIGVRPGSRVSLLVPPGADLTAALYASLRIGAVVVVADAGLGLAGLTRAVRGARPDFIIGVPEALAAACALGWPGTRISTATLPVAARRMLGVRHSLGGLVRAGTGRPLPEVPAPDDLAAVLFTSGSTGPAKGVRYTHRALAGVRDALRATYGVGRDTGLVAGFAPFALLGPALGCRTATPDMDVTRPGTLTASALADAVHAVEADVLFLSPAAMANTLATPGTAADGRGAGAAAFDRIRLVLSAGAPIGEPLLARAAALFPAASLHTPYGMTEALLLTDITLDGIRAAGVGDGVCVGAPVASARIRIAPLDPDGRAAREPEDAATGVTGEILVSAPHLLDGYDRLWLTDRAARADVRATSNSAAERWHRTGDVGHLDATGRLWVEGRLPHVIVTATGVVTPVGVEQRVERAIADPVFDIAGAGRVAAVGVGPRGTQQLVVIVEADARRPGVAASPLAEAVRAAVTHPVAAVLTVPQLPTDIRHRSKIDRTALAAWATGVLDGGRVRLP